MTGATGGASALQGQHSSVGRRLWIALIASSAIALIICAVSLTAFQYTRNSMQEMADIHQRRVDALHELGRTTQALVIAAQSLASTDADGRDVLTQRLSDVHRAEDRVYSALALVHAIGSEFPGLDGIENINRRLSVQLQMLVSAADEAARQRYLSEAAIEQLHVIAQELRLALPQDGKVPGDSRYLNDIIQIFAQLAALENMADVEELSRSEKKTLSALRAVETALRDMPPDDPMGQVIQRLSNTLTSETGLLKSLEARQGVTAFMEARLNDITRLNESMTGAGAAVAARARGELISANARLRQALDYASAAMIALALLGVGGSALFAWRYVGQNLIARLNALQQRMLSLADGDFDSPIEVKGGDEVAGMARALLVFRSAMKDLTEAKAETTKAHDRLKDAVESLQEGFALFDASGRAILTNSWLWSLLPPGARTVPASWTLDTLLAWLATCDQPAPERAHLSLMNRLADAEELRISASTWIVARLGRSPSGEYVFVAADVTRLKEREAEVKRGSALMNVVFDQLDQGIGVYNKDLILERANESFATILGLAQDLALPGTRLEDIYRAVLPHGMNEAELTRQMTKIRNHSYERRVEMKTRAGRLLDLRRGPMPEGGYVVSFSDITEERRVRRRMAHLVNHDPVTDLLNRVSFEERVKSHLTAPKPDFAVGILSVLGFKDINDTFGRDAGDTILRHAAKALQSQMPHGAAVARMGADDFAILIPSAAEPEELERIGRDCVDAVAGELPIGGLSINVGAVMGIATCADGKLVAHDIIRAAEQAQQLCEPGSNVKRFDSAMGETARRRAFLRAELGHAIQSDQVWVAYQPKIDLRSGRVTGMEALARWTHPEAGPISPGDFIPIAERSGHIIALSNLVLKNAMRDCARWNRQGFGPLKVAVNVSPVQLFGQDVMAVVRGTMQEFDLAPQHLEIEITESTLMHDDAKALRTLEELRNIGISIAIDDFGTGYSSLSYLKRLPVDVLKIDRTFVRDLPGDQEGLRLARAILGLSHDFGFYTVAEGVESEDQLTFLRQNGCDFGQGFLFAKPLPADAFESFLRTRMTAAINLGGD